MGLAIAGLLASLGADIALDGLGKPEDSEHVVKALRKRHDVHVQHFEGDFTDSSCFVPMIECIAAALGAPDILINNAGMQYVSPILSFPPEKRYMMLAVRSERRGVRDRVCRNV